jgi:hypothetical protein
VSARSLTRRAPPRYLMQNQRRLQRADKEPGDVLTYRVDTPSHLAVVDSPVADSPFYPDNPHYQSDPAMSASARAGWSLCAAPFMDAAQRTGTLTSPLW